MGSPPPLFLTKYTYSETPIKKTKTQNTKKNKRKKQQQTNASNNHIFVS